MSTSHYYGLTVGASVTWRGDKVMECKVGSVDRHVPEGAGWTLRFTPRHERFAGGIITDRKIRKDLAARLHELSLQHHTSQMDAQTFMGAVDTAIALRCGPISTLSREG